MVKARNRYWIVWLNNTTDCQDDEPVKVRAKTREEAGHIAYDHKKPRFCVGNVYTLKEFREWEPWWSSVLRKQKAVNE